MWQNHTGDVKTTGVWQQSWGGQYSVATSRELCGRFDGRLWDSSTAPAEWHPPTPSAAGVAASWDPSGLTKGAASACLVPLLSSPGLVPAVHGPWAVAGGAGCRCMSRVGHGPPTGFAGPPPLPPSRLHLSLSSAGGGVAPTTRGFEDFS